MKSRWLAGPRRTYMAHPILAIVVMSLVTLTAGFSIGNVIMSYVSPHVGTPAPVPVQVRTSQSALKQAPAKTSQSYPGRPGPVTTATSAYNTPAPTKELPAYSAPETPLAPLAPVTPIRTSAASASVSPSVTVSVSPSPLPSVTPSPSPDLSPSPSPSPTPDPEPDLIGGSS
jgi:hypothetical protein